jgi:hypothetical protein
MGIYQLNNSHRIHIDRSNIVAIARVTSSEICATAHTDKELKIVRAWLAKGSQEMKEERFISF